MMRLLREPLLHFLLIGAALFAASSLLAGRDRPRGDAIVVSAGKIEHLAALFARTWQRPPSRVELEGLIDDFVREEVAYREGMAAGLDRDDTIIRRRIRQKLEFVAEDLARQAAPSDEDLAAYLAAHPDQFRFEPRVTLRHVFLDPERRRGSLESDARAMLAELNGDPDGDARLLGDRILLEHAYADVTQREAAGLFGSAFASAIVGLEPGSWHGPIPSGYGAHLVRVDSRTEGRLPGLEEIRPAVAREWANARRVETTARFYDDLLERYEIVIEWPEPQQGAAGQAATEAAP